MVRTLLIFTLVTLLYGCASLEDDTEPKATPVFYDPEDYVEVCTGNNRANTRCELVKKEHLERQMRRIFRL